ncbi:mechanosensitive ion channel family protein [Halobellus limi]|uniref:Mechanosensitive ion channel family protein n=1 Tax=Halobellus limi TaxID=699433 RepID=A0A1H5U481_9EURY|nr:mechanosensitive ion channel family protein [Halobellus limi]QCC47167.1 mechanosensitive ion channel family protein [Halobellus limi]SEF69041.1 Small-conductance mechanosensitive channel [Halobellus limi]
MSGILQTSTGGLGGVESALAALSELVPTFTGRLAVTFAIGVATMALLARTDRVHAAAPERLPSTAWHLLVTLGTMFLAATAGVAIVGVWGLSDELIGVFGPNYGPETIVQIGISLLFLIGAYTMTGLVRQLAEELAETRSSIGEHEGEIAFRVGQVTLYLLAFTIILALWDVNVGGILVGAGFLGIVVGMAARQTLGALLAGFVLMFSRPFEIGDWIQVGDYEGIVTDITIVNTRIQTFDGEYVMIPNDVVSSESLVNRSRKGRLRIEIEVGIDYDADPEHAAEVAKRAVSELDDPMNVPTPQVVLKRLDDSAVVLGVRYWIDNPSARRKWRSKTAVIGAVKEALEAEGIKIPFPQRELMGRSEEGGFVLAGDERPAEPQVEPTPDGGDGGGGDS